MCKYVKSLSCVQLFVTSWTVAYQASLSMGFSRQEYWRELPFPSPGDLPNRGTEPGSPALEADALTSEPPGKWRKDKVKCPLYNEMVLEIGRNWLMFSQRSVLSLSCVRLFAAPWTVAYQAPPSMEFSRQEYWSGLPFPSPGDLPNRGIEPGSPCLQADTLPSEPPGKPGAMHGHCFIELDKAVVHVISLISFL